MSNNELKLIANFLKILSESLSNNICNDVDESFFNEWSDEEKTRLGNEISEWIGDDDFKFEEMLGYDHYLVKFLADKL